MKFLFTRPHPLLDQLRTEGHIVVLKSVDDFPSDDGDPPGEEYPLSVMLRQVDPDVLVLVDLGHVWYAKGVVLKWARINTKTTVGITDARGYACKRQGKMTGCNVMANHCSVFVTDDEKTAVANTSNGRTVHHTGRTEPVLAAIKHCQTRKPYNRRSPRPWR